MLNHLVCVESSGGWVVDVFFVRFFLKGSMDNSVCACVCVSGAVVDVEW